jgi:AraC-like DNA-binding protein
MQSLSLNATDIPDNQHATIMLQQHIDHIRGVGFSNDSYFNKIFRRNRGISPAPKHLQTFQNMPPKTRIKCGQASFLGIPGWHFPPQDGRGGDYLSTKIPEEPKKENALAVSRCRNAEQKYLFCF